MSPEVRQLLYVYNIEDEKNPKINGVCICKGLSCAAFNIESVYQSLTNALYQSLEIGFYTYVNIQENYIHIG
jgi:hypothetical protein